MLENLGPKNIVLIGFMGTGKSMVSNELARILNWPVISTDKAVEERTNEAISDTFKTQGEAFFRQIEHEIILQIAQKTNVIIDCGGGIVLNPNNTAALKKNGILIHLKASAEFIYSVVQKQEKRPLLDVEDPQLKIVELLNERKGLYAKAADIEVVSENKPIPDIALEIVEVLKNE